jgi:catechol 2,3-dioxygenase-like lactoylglutathione lyase family enzyme
MPPSKLAHVVFQTNQIPRMRDWYCAVLGARVVYENPHLCFITYDDEHHRVAFADFGQLAPRERDTELMIKPTEQPGLHHAAFTFATLGELLDTYARLKERGIRPFFCVNHGPTTSTLRPPKRVWRGCIRRRSTRTRSASSTTPISSSRASRPASRWPSSSSAGTDSARRAIAGAAAGRRYSGVRPLAS